MGLYRKFGKHRLRVYVATRTKKMALEEKRQYKKQGRKVRIIKTKEGYDVYTHALKRGRR